MAGPFTPMLDEEAFEFLLCPESVEKSPELELGAAVLSLEEKQGLYRIAQEALHNAARHARAKTIGVRLVSDASQIRLEVWDDGIGFDVARAHPGHLGLHTMQERARELGGALQIESSAGAGTKVRVVRPLTAVPAGKARPARR